MEVEIALKGSVLNNSSELESGSPDIGLTNINLLRTLNGLYLDISYLEQIF